MVISKAIMKLRYYFYSQSEDEESMECEMLPDECEMGQ